MTLGAMFRRELFAARGFEGNGCVIEATSPVGVGRLEAVAVRGDAASIETLGCRLRSLEVKSNVGPWDASSLRTFADGAAMRVSYLLERLRPIELDMRGRQAMIRSDKPRMQGPNGQYYELIADGGRKASLRRFAFTVGTSGKVEIDFVLTGDQLEILVNDLVDLLAATE